MSDVMLLGVLQMPFEMVTSDYMSTFQYVQRGHEAAVRIMADAELIEQQAARIANLEAQIAAVAPAVDAQPVGWAWKPRGGSLDFSDAQDRPSEVDLEYAKETGGEFVPLYTSAQSEGLRKPDGVEIASYCLTEDADVIVQSVRQITGPDLWAVRRAGNCLGKNGEWEYEPLPSSRDDDFLARYRFASAQEAIDAALSQKESGE